MASAYIYIYLIVLGCIIWRQYSAPIRYSAFNINKTSTESGSTFLLMMVCSLFIGVRPVDNVFADMVVYNKEYQEYIGELFEFDSEAENIIFDNIAPLLASWNLPVEVFFTLIATIYFGCMYIACKKLFPNNLLVAYLACLTAFSTFSYATNGVKAGAAASIFLVALAYKDNLKISILLAILSWGFHHSMSMVVIAYFCSLFFKKTKWYFLCWLAACIIAILHISYFQIMFAGYTDAKGASYLLTDGNSYLTGFRPDFMLYSAMPIIVGYYLIYKKHIQDKGYELWLRMYLLTNSIWMVCMYASFSNRIAYLSWFLYPIVLVYPFFKIRWSANQTLYAKRAVLYNFLFTLFMEVVYYTIIK